MDAPDLATARRWIARHFGAPPGLRPLGQGEDYVVFETDDGWAYRFPRHAETGPRLRVEVAILQRLRHLPVAVPQPERVAEPRDDQPWPFVGYRKLGGVTVAQAGHPEPRALIDAIEEVLEVVHATPAVEPFTRAEGWPEGALTAPNAVAEAVVGFVEEHASEGPTVFCHGDMGMGHVLVEADGGRLRGIIDWGDAAWTDPAIDWVGLLWQFPDAMDEAYGSARPEPLRRAWGHGLRFGLLDCLEMREHGADDAVLARAWAKLARRLERARRSAAIG